MTDDVDSRADWFPWSIAVPPNSKGLTQSFPRQILWSIVFPFLITGVGSLFICIPIILYEADYHLISLIAEAIGLGLSWQVVVSAIFGTLFLLQLFAWTFTSAGNIVAEAMKFALNIAKGLRLFIVERTIYFFCGESPGFRTEMAVRVLFLSVFLLGTGFLANLCATETWQLARGLSPLVFAGRHSLHDYLFEAGRTAYKDYLGPITFGHLPVDSVILSLQRQSSEWHPSPTPSAPPTQHDLEATKKILDEAFPPPLFRDDPLPPSLSPSKDGSQPTSLSQMLEEQRRIAVHQSHLDSAPPSYLSTALSTALLSVIVGFPSLLSFGFALVFASNFVHQAFGLRGAVRRAALPLFSLSDERIVGSGAEITVAHLSDLHLTERDDVALLEGGGHATPNANFRRASGRLRSDIGKIDLVLITGDITDSGAPEEWRNFFQILPSEVMEKTIILPGNHDLNITNKHNLWDAEKPSFTARKIRIIRMIAGLDAIQGERCRLLDTSGSLLLLSRYLDDKRDFLRNFGRSGGQTKQFDPDPIWQDMFPLMVELPQAQAVLFLLDSNDVSANLVDNAFGLVGAAQMRRLEQMIELRRDDNQLFALHHHLVLPGRLHSSLFKNRLFERFMVLQNWRAVIDLMTARRPTVIFHGHRHVEYEGSLGPAEVVSARSTTLGDAVSGEPPGYRVFVLGEGPSGGLAVSRAYFKHTACDERLAHRILRRAG